MTAGRHIHSFPTTSPPLGPAAASSATNIQTCVRDYVQAQDKATRAFEDAKKCAEVARAEVQESLLANSKHEQHPPHEKGKKPLTRLQPSSRKL